MVVSGLRVVGVVCDIMSLEDILERNINENF